MKTLLLAPQPYFSYRGTPMNVRTMLAILSEAGISVDLLTYPTGDDTPLPGLTIHRVRRPPGLRKVAIGPSGAKLLLDAEMLPAAWRLARRGGYRMVHAVEEAVFIGILLKRRFKLPLIYDMDSSMADQLADYGWARGPLRRLAGGMEHWAVRRSDAVITVCRALTDIVRGIDPGKTVFQIEDIPLSLDQPEAPPDAAALETALRGRKVLLYTGNLEPYQGITLLLEAMPEVVGRHPESLLVLVGGSGQPLKKLRDEVRRRGLERSVLTVEPRPSSQMNWFMERAHALVSPRLKGTNTPLKIYTYLQSGRPVVATRMPTHTQVLEDGWAVLVEPTGAGMAGGLRRVLEQPDEAAVLGREGRRVVEERHSREHFRRGLLAAYQAVGGYEPA